MVPRKSPLMWIGINIAMSLYSLLLLEMDFFADKERTRFASLADGHYLVYQFIAVLVWLLQELLVLFDIGWKDAPTGKKFTTGLAFVVFWYSTQSLIHWQIRADNITGDALWTGLTFLYYAYETTELIKRVLARPPIVVQIIEHGGGNADGNESVVGIGASGYLPVFHDDDDVSECSGRYFRDLSSKKTWSLSQSSTTSTSVTEDSPLLQKDGGERLTI